MGDTNRAPRWMGIFPDSRSLPEAAFRDSTYVSRVTHVTRRLGSPHSDGMRPPEAPLRAAARSCLPCQYDGLPQFLAVDSQTHEEHAIAKPATILTAKLHAFSESSGPCDSA